MLQIISVVLLLASAALAAAELRPGTTHSLSFRDVDGNDLSTSGGRVTIVTVVTRETEAQARAAAALVPERCIGDPNYRYITLVNFQGKVPSPLRGITRAVIRGRLDAEAKGLKPRYDAKKLTRDPRGDVYVVADFDGSAVSRLGLEPESNGVTVFIFDGRGKLVARWTDVPAADAFGKALADAEQTLRAARQ